MPSPGWDGGGVRQKGERRGEVSPELSPGLKLERKKAGGVDQALGSTAPCRCRVPAETSGLAVQVYLPARGPFHQVAALSASEEGSGSGCLLGLGAEGSFYFSSLKKKNPVFF